MKLNIEKLFLAIAAGIAAAKLTDMQQNAFIETVQEGGFKIDLLGLEKWEPPTAAKPYLKMLNNAEKYHGLPENLLVRVAYQESRFRDDIIKGETVSSAGAVGIMQIVPRWHPNVNPLNVPEAIDYAAEYLAKLKAQTGSWEMALAAYNWGIGNLRVKGFSNAPKETRDYVTQIAGDVLGTYA